MNLSKRQLWERFKRYYTEYPSIGLSLDLSRMKFADDFIPSMRPRIDESLSAMADLERGAIADPDENRMVGHYWLRNPGMAPTPEIRQQIQDTLAAVKAFARKVHDGTLRGAHGSFKNLLLIGIGGSALGPQFVSHALGHPLSDKLRFYSFDNTDPDGMDRVLPEIGSELGRTLCLVISKSGRTQETRNGMLEAEAAYKRSELSFGSHAAGITQEGSHLDTYAAKNNWIRRFPMWDWVGGRTSEMSAVGPVPAALQGIDVEAMLEGARARDEVTTNANVTVNPSLLLALALFHSGNGTVAKNMVVILYKDRLELFSKYLQQLVMESLGKAKDLDDRIVHQGICVLGNKESTDQHSYIQRLRDGLNNFFVTFVEVKRDRHSSSIEVEDNIHSGDLLHGFMLGTRQALFEQDWESVSIGINEVSPFSVGVLIALFERAVGYYASMVNINAYRQPGVEAGKKAASAVIHLELRILNYLVKSAGRNSTVTEISEAIQAPEEIETVFKVCEHLAMNPDRSIVKTLGRSPFDAGYQKH